MKKLKINNYTIIFFFFALIAGFIKDALLIFLIVIFHEMGHLFFSKLFGYKIICVSLYPFGGIVKYENLINSNSYKDLIIFWGGIFFQIFLFFFLFFFLKLGYLSSYTYSLFLKYNLSIMLFNLIPIIPLDGYLILDWILNCFFNFKKTFKLSFFISAVMIIIFLIFNYYLKLNNYFIVLLFIFKMYEYFKNFKYVQKRFLLERYLYNLDFKYEDEFNCLNLDYLKKNHHAKFYFDKKWIDEHELLAKMFDNNG